jgi:hypothetical protein
MAFSCARNGPPEGVDLGAESRFLECSDSAVSRLEKQPKNTIYSTAYGSRLCAMRKSPFMAEIASDQRLFAPLIRDILEGFT